MTVSPRRFSKIAVFSAWLCALSVPALAADSQVQFHPVKPWVGEALPGPGGTPVCSSRTEYNNGFVLQFASSARGLEMIAVNFRQNVFKDGQSYPVQIGIENGPARDVTAKARGGGQLNIPLSGDAAFLDALKNAPSLNLRIEDNDFRFFLVGFKDAFSNLTSCAPAAAAPSFESGKSGGAAAGLIVPPNTQGTALAPLPPPVVVPSPQGKIAADAAPSSAAPVPLMPAAPRQAPSRAADYARSESIFSSAQEGGEGAATRVRALSPPAAVKAEPASMPASTPANVSADMPAAVPANPVQPPPVSAKPIPAPVAAPKPSAPVEETIKWNTPPAAPASPPAPPVAESKTWRTPDPVVKREVVRQAPIDLTKSAAPDKAWDKQQGDREMAMKISELEQTVARLKQENAALDHDFKSTVSASAEEQTSISSSNWDLEKATMRYQEADREIKRLGLKLQQERASCNGDKKDLESMLFDPRVTDEKQMAKLADLEQQLAAAQQALTDQRIHYEERLKILESQATTR